MAINCRGLLTFSSEEQHWWPRVWILVSISGECKFTRNFHSHGGSPSSLESLFAGKSEKQLIQNWGYPPWLWNPPIIARNPPDVFASHQWICLIRNKAAEHQELTRFLHRFVGPVGVLSVAMKCRNSVLTGGFSHQIWVNYNISLTWIKAILGWFPLLTMIIVRENSEVVIIYPDKISTVHDRWWPQAMENQLTRWGVPEIGVPPVLIQHYKPPFHIGFVWKIGTATQKFLVHSHISYHMCHKNC